MSTLAPTLQAFFTDRLARQRQASPHTIAAYRDTVKLLLVFAASSAGVRVVAMRTCAPYPAVGGRGRCSVLAATGIYPPEPGWAGLDGYGYGGGCS